MNIQEWADSVNLAAATAAVIEAGLQLEKAKRALPHGEWGKMFNEHPQHVDRPLKFSIDTAERLMAIGRHPILSNSEHVRYLPLSWGTLYELTKIDKPLLLKAISDGRITPEMERKEVASLRPPPEEEKPSKEAGKRRVTASAHKNEPIEKRPPASGTVAGWKQAAVLVWSLTDDTLTNAEFTSSQRRSILADMAKISKAVSQVRRKL